MAPRRSSSLDRKGLCLACDSSTAPEPEMGSYQKFVETQRAYNPCLMNLHDFLSNPQMKSRRPRILSLDFYSGQTAPFQQNLDPSGLTSLLRGTHESNGCDARSVSSTVEIPKEKPPGLRLLVIEDLSKDVIQTLGSTLNIDPLFFASHLHSPRKTLDTQTPDQATLPSRTRPKKYINIHYHRAVVFETPVPAGDKLYREANVGRKVMVLPWTKTKRIGLAQHCVSLYYTRENDMNLCLVLVDPPLTDNYFYYEGHDPYSQDIHLPTKLYLGGYEDFQDPTPKRQGYRKPSKLSLFDDLLNYWTYGPDSLTNSAKPKLASLAYVPLKIVAAEWMLYTSIMHKGIKKYEYSGSDQMGSVAELERLQSDMRALQSWRRRSMSSQQKIQAVLRHVKAWSEAELDGRREELLEDYDFLASTIDNFGRRLEEMLPVVTSLVLVVDSRRSFAETANVTRLTVLALVFVPLNYTSSLFSMMPEVAPGGPNFWLYFAVAIPITVLVFLIARPPFQRIKAATRRFWTWRLAKVIGRESEVSLDKER